MVLTVIFWVLFVLCVVSFFVPPPYTKANSGIMLVLIGILGYKVLHNPLTQ